MIKLREDFYIRETMFCKRSILFVILTNFVFFNNGEVIQDGSGKLDPANATPQAQDWITDETHKPKGIIIDYLNNKGAIEDGNTGNCREKTSAASNRDNKMDGCPYKSKELCLIFSLSKIAKIQVATSSDPRERGFKSKIVGSARKHAENVQNSGKLEGSDKLLFNLRERLGAGPFENSSKKQVKQSNLPCQAVRDVYIPDVRQKLPAFACKFGNRMFILSSARFFQDRRSYLDINIDEDTLNNIKSIPKISRSNELNVIPALLFLRFGDSYGIQTYKNISHERKVNRDKGN